MTSELTEITLIGEDDTGLIANITSLLFERGINIEDLDQAVHSDTFRMTMHVDTADMVTAPETLRADLNDLGDDLGLEVRVRFPAEREARRIAILVTKESHCLRRLLTADAAGELDAEISVVIGNHDDLAPIAEDYEIPFFDIGDASGQPDEDWMVDILDDHDIDLVVLARFMRILGPDVVFRYENRIINVHPSLLPAFPGAQAYRQALDEGVRIAGVTAHYVTTDLDQGPIIVQRAFTVPDSAIRADAENDRAAAVTAMEARGQPLEADALLEAIKLHLNDDVIVRRGRTQLRNGANGYELGLPPAADEQSPDEPVDD